MVRITKVGKVTGRTEAGNRVTGKEKERTIRTAKARTELVMNNKMIGGTGNGAQIMVKEL